MRLILLLLINLAIPNLVLAQKNVDLGKIQFDTAFSCTDSIGQRFSDRSFGVGDICDSKNELEIRLKMFYRPGGGRELIIFSWSNENWGVQNYRLTAGGLGQKLISTSYPNINRSDIVNADIICTPILTQLVNNKIFLLPDQRELNHQMIVFDGLALVISFKVDDKFRRYWYENPDSYSDHYPGSTEYLNVIEIIKILRSLL